MGFCICGFVCYQVVYSLQSNTYRARPVLFRYTHEQHGGPCSVPLMSCRLLSLKMKASVFIKLPPSTALQCCPCSGAQVVTSRENKCQMSFLRAMDSVVMSQPYILTERSLNKSTFKQSLNILISWLNGKVWSEFGRYLAPFLPLGILVVLDQFSSSCLLDSEQVSCTVLAIRCRKAALFFVFLKSVGCSRHKWIYA